MQYDTTSHDKVTLGGTSPTTPVTLTNVANGVANSDAVNMAQLKAMGASTDSSGNVTNSFVAYDDSTQGTITLKGKTGTKITDLAAGSLSASSTDAVNGAQLFATNQNVTSVAGNLVNVTNTVNNIVNGGGIKYFHANSTLADSSATGTDAVAIGGAASATATNSVALGANSVASRANTVDVGLRQITDVANGTQAMDAVNLSQLQAMGANINSSGVVTNSFVAYDDSTKSKVTLGGTSSTPVTLTNVANGVANSDAVNMAQLKAMGASTDSSGNVTNSFVAYDDSTQGTITLKGKTGTKITDLAAGGLSASSTDAVNGAQLFATNQNVTNVAGNMVNVTNTVNNIVNGGGIKYFHANSTLADSSATGTNAVAIGGAASATAANSVALGANSVASRANTVDVGLRQITDVANGAQAMDAVNLSQLQAMGANIDSSGVVTNSFVAYDNSAKSAITLGGLGSTNPVSLTNLAAGQVTSTSRDAVNGSQLYNTASSVAAALGGGSAVRPNGQVTAPSYVIDNGQTFNDVGSALSNLDGQIGQVVAQDSTNQKYIKVVSTASQALASGVESVAIGGNSLATADHALAIGSGASATYANSTALGVNAVTDAANTLSVGSRGAEVRITHVANGINLTDAATVGQLDALQTQFAQQTSNVKSMLMSSSPMLGATPVTSYIAVSQNVVQGASTATSNDLNAMAIGPVADAVGVNALAVGGGTVAGSNGSTAVGSAAGALSVNSTVIGAGATVAALSDNSVAIGYNARASAINSLAFGTTASSTATGSVAIGYNTFVGQSATNGMAFGLNASVSAVGGVAIGANSVANRANAVSVGSSTQQSQIINVAAGTQGTDAVNLAQMNAAIAAGGGSGGPTNAVLYDGTTQTSVTLGGASATAPVALTNIAAGKITSSSLDAVNGSQLYNTANSVAAALGGNASVGTDGKVSKPAYTLNGATFNDVGAALAAVNAVANNSSVNGVVYDTTSHNTVTLGGVGSTTGPVRVSNVADGVANNDAVNVEQLKAMGAGFDSSGNVTGAFVAYDNESKGQVTFGGAGSTTPVVLANVAAGQITSGSTQAVNGSQLYSTANSVAEALGGKSSVDTNGRITNPSYAVDGGTYNDVGSAINAVAALAATGSPNGVVYDTSKHDMLTLGGVGATTGPVTVANVAAATTDDEAVNLKQLKDAGLNVDTSGNVTNAFVAYDNASKETVTFNAGGAPTQLKNVAAATDLTDAVNFGQMQSYVTDHAGGGGTSNAVAYDDSTKSQVTLGGVGSATPVVLTNVAAGSNATDAVNYSQFSGLESQVNNLATGGGTSNTYVNIGAPGDGTTGTAASAAGTDAIAIGNGAVASGDSAIAIGARTTTTGNHSVALGDGASAPNTNSVALGSNSTTDRDNSVSVGSAGAERQITNVAAGTQATDAVNVGQLNNAIGGLNNSISTVDRSAAKGIASASALNIVTPYLPGRTTLNAGVANYRGYQSVGLGVSRWNEKGTINYNLGVSTSGGNSTIVRAGIGIVLGN